MVLRWIIIRKQELSWRSFKGIKFNRLDLLELPIWPLSTQLIVIGILAFSVYFTANQLLLSPLRQEIEKSQQQEQKLLEIGGSKQDNTDQLQFSQNKLKQLEQKNKLISQSLTERKQLAALLSSINQAALASKLDIKQLNWAQSQQTPHFEIWPMEIELHGHFFDIQTFIQKVVTMPSLLLFSESIWTKNSLAGDTIHLNAKLYTFLALDDL